MSFPTPQQQSVSAICGTFADPTTPDQGQCFPYKSSQTCDAPTLPVASCSDDQYTTTYDPLTQSFTVTARMFDQNCQPILDQNGATITTVIT